MYTYIEGSDHSVTLLNFVAKSRQKQQLIAGSLKSSGGVSHKDPTRVLSYTSFEMFNFAVRTPLALATIQINLETQQYE